MRNDNSELSSQALAPPSWFSTLVHRGKALTRVVGVVVVANVKGRTIPTEDYVGDSIISEFLSAAELDTVVEYFESAGLYSEVLLDEDGFIKWLGRGRSQFPRRHVFVYNLAQNGVGPARLTTVAALCRLHRIPLVDSDAHAVAIAHHKFHSLSLLRQLGLPVARCWSYSQRGWLPEPPPSNTRLIMKPTYESASVGIADECVFTMSRDSEYSLEERVARYRQPMTVQEFVPGFELEVPVFEADGPKAIAAIGIALSEQRHLGSQVMTYDRVFDDRYTFYDFAEESLAGAGEAMRVACQAFRVLGLSGIARVDFRATEVHVPLIMEVACKPHITQHSGVMSALRGVGASGSDLAHFLIGSTAARYGLTS